MYCPIQSLSAKKPLLLAIHLQYIFVTNFSWSADNVNVYQYQSCYGIEDRSKLQMPCIFTKMNRIVLLLRRKYSLMYVNCTITIHEQWSIDYLLSCIRLIILEHILRRYTCALFLIWTSYRKIRLLQYFNYRENVYDDGRRIWVNASWLLISEWD